MESHCESDSVCRNQKQSGIHASSRDLYPIAGYGPAKFGKLKHNGCIQAKPLSKNRLDSSSILQAIVLRVNMGGVEQVAIS